jgi:hypothetical protein
MQESGKVLQAKKIRFHARDKSKLVLRKSALHKQQLRVKYTYLVRSGKVREEDLFARKPRSRK